MCKDLDDYFNIPQEDIRKGLRGPTTIRIQADVIEQIRTTAVHAMRFSLRLEIQRQSQIQRQTICRRSSISTLFGLSSIFVRIRT